MKGVRFWGQEEVSCFFSVGLVSDEACSLRCGVPPIFSKLSNTQCNVLTTRVRNEIAMNSPKVPEGLEAFLAHAESLHPSVNPKRENGFAKEFQVCNL